MDAAYVNPTRKFPSYATKDLKAAIEQYEAGTHPLQACLDPAHLDALKVEVANREKGISKPFVVPQVM